ncbi:protein FAM210B, mitochondrial isoform X2 [Trichomycterus rosablanca]|uniref:protein FAM210B, mitochondrial isoform X2 n=1 Tax=Trichomycterus rosablanca TaxID=2290929 RepID=UPI002F35A1CF
MPSQTLNLLHVFRSRALLNSHYRWKTTMFFCWGARFAASSFCLYYNSARSVQMRHNYIISCLQINVRRTHSLFRPLQDISVKITQWNFIHVSQLGTASTTASKSTSTPKPEFAMFLSPRIKMRQWANDSLCLPTFFNFYLMATLTDKLLKRALSNVFKPTQITFANRTPTTDTQRVQLSNGPKEGAEIPEPEDNQNKTNQLKKVFKEYGAVGVSFHIGISVISLGIFYVALSRLVCQLRDPGRADRSLRLLVAVLGLALLGVPLLSLRS